MTDLRLWRIGEYAYEIDLSCVRIGKVIMTENPFHAETCHLSLLLDEYDPRLARPLCGLLRAELGKPLQVMLYSWETQKADFLTEGGFRLARRCYEVEITARELTWKATNTHDFSIIRKGDTEYDQCCLCVYRSYAESHQSISPLTVSYEVFREQLPDTVICERISDSIRHLAFIEESDEDMEIAYVASEDISVFSDFAKDLLSYLSTRAVRVCFECDDCDPLAMVLYRLSGADNEESYDTYILN